MNVIKKATEVKDFVKTIGIEEALQTKGYNLVAADVQKPPLVRDFAVVRTRYNIADTAPYRLDFFAIVLCLKGAAKMSSGQYNYTIRPGTIRFVFPSMIHMLEDKSDDFELQIVVFSRAFFDQLQLKEPAFEAMLSQTADFPYVFDLDKQCFQKVSEMISAMQQELERKDKYYIKIIQAMLTQLFYLSSRVFEKQGSLQPASISRGFKMVQAFKAAVDQHFLAERTVQWYADQLFVTAGYLGELVKKETGETAIRHIHRRIYQEAHDLLTYTDLSVKEISDQLNFDTPSHFSRFFKQFAGFAPTALKKIA